MNTSVSWAYSSTIGGLRVRLRSATCRFESRRCCTAEADGRVLRRARGGGLAASASRSIAAAHAAARLRNCDLDADDEAEIDRPARLTTLSCTVEFKPTRST